MSIQWTFIAGYLYFEIAVVIIMMLPIFSPRRWHQFFKSRLFTMFHQHAAVYFYVLLGVLSLFLLDAIREMRKYSHSSDSSHIHLASELKGNVKLFRAQRNFYITGFTIFLAFVIRRLGNMLIIQDELTTKAEILYKKAESTVQEAKTSILASAMQDEKCKNFDEIKSKLEETEDKLNESNQMVKILEDEVSHWKLRYDELSIQLSAGSGDRLE